MDISKDIFSKVAKVYDMVLSQLLTLIDRYHIMKTYSVRSIQMLPQQIGGKIHSISSIDHAELRNMSNIVVIVYCFMWCTFWY